MLLLLAAIAVAAAAADGDVVLTKLFSDVVTSRSYRYDMKDSTSNQMACVHAYHAHNPAIWSGNRYYAVYQAMVGDEFQVRLARSNDLMEWTFVRTLVANADMPFIKQVNGSDWLLLTHEQWMTSKSRTPSRLGFKVGS
jgi:hypothetical protein